MSSRITRGVKGVLSGTKNLALRATTESLKPRWLVLMVTDRCNSRCEHCNIWRQEPTKDPLTPKELETTLGDPHFGGVEYILNTGGEPALRHDLEEIFLVEHKTLPKAKLQLSTNGLLPERVIDVVKFVITHDINIDVGVSLDGIGEKHDLIRGVKGNFEKADRLLHELVELRESHRDRLDIAAGIVISDLTLDSLEEVRTYTTELDISLIEAWYNEALFYSNIGENPVSSKIIKAVESQPNSLLREMWLKRLKGKSIRFPCFAMYTFCVLQCNGDISPCLSLWDAKAGNVRESSPTQTWHSPEAKKVRKMVKDCPGCLNSWGVGWSLSCSYYPYLLYLLRHPRILVGRLRGG